MTDSEPRIVVVMDVELTHDFGGIRITDDSGIETVLWCLNADKNVQLFIDGVEYGLPPSDATYARPTRNGFIDMFDSWQIKSFRKHLKHCVDIHRSFYSEHA